jgi:hypothetical protein
MKPTLKLPGCKQLELRYDELLSSFAFSFNLRRYNTGSPDNLSIFEALSWDDLRVGPGTNPHL